MSGFEIGFFVVMAFVVGTLWGLYWVERIVQGWNFLWGKLRSFRQESRELRREIDVLKQTLEYRDRSNATYKTSFDELTKHLRDAELSVQLLKNERDTLKRNLLKANETLASYAKLLTDERMEGVHQAHQIGDLKNENVRLAAVIDELEKAKEIPKKKSARIFHELHKR